MKHWDDMTPAEQDDLYPVWLAALWCVGVGGLLVAFPIGALVYILVA